MNENELTIWKPSVEKSKYIDGCIQIFVKKGDKYFMLSDEQRAEWRVRLPNRIEKFFKITLDDKVSSYLRICQEFCDRTNEKEIESHKSDKEVEKYLILKGYKIGE